MRLPLVLLVAFVAISSASAAPKPEPQFRVSITSTLVERHVVELVWPGCTLEHRGDVTRTIEAWTRAPVPRTLTQLLKGGDTNNFVELAGRERRQGSYVENVMSGGCEQPSYTPRLVDETTTCGERSFSVERIGVGVGFMNKGRDGRFRFFYSRLGADPFERGCLSKLVEIAAVNFPPGTGWHGRDPRQTWVDVDLARLKAGKPVVARFHDTARYDWPPGNPVNAHRNVQYKEWTVTWEVRIDPVARKR